MISGVLKKFMSHANDINTVVVSSFVPGLKEYLLKNFNGINFYFIPVQKLPNKLTPILNEECNQILKDAKIIMADAAIGAQLLGFSPNLVWLQAVSAGIESFFKYVEKDKVPTNLVFTRMTNVFGDVMAEYVISQIIIRERHFFQFYDNQKLQKWDQIQWGYRCLSDLTIGIMGLGEIGLEIAKLCKGFGALVVGLSRTIHSNKEPFIDVYKTIDDLPSFLESCDYIVSVLPSTPQTRGLLDSQVLSHCKNKNTVFVNIGRGDLVSDAALIEAIKNKWLAGAILDVFEEEPLPSTHPFWSIPEITITPHVSGTSMPRLIGKVFKENLRRFEKKEPMLGVVNMDRQY